MLAKIYFTRTWMEKADVFLYFLFIAPLKAMVTYAYNQIFGTNIPIWTTRPVYLANPGGKKRSLLARDDNNGYCSISEGADQTCPAPSSDALKNAVGLIAQGLVFSRQGEALWKSVDQFNEVLSKPFSC